MEYKFKVGDKVRICHSGSGCGENTIGKIVIITELGNYCGAAGYKIDNLTLQTNTKSGQFNGFIGERSFELVEEKKLDINFKVGDTVKIIKRLPGNPTGSLDFNKPNGDVGRIGIIKEITTNNNRKVAQITESESGIYLGYFELAVEIELYQESKPESKPEFQFQEGKWYKSKSGNYGKLLLKNKGYTFPKDFPAKEYIGDKRYHNDGSYFTYDNMIPEEIDLSEIQEYLPDKHPDKMEKTKLFVGRYIKALRNKPDGGSVKSGEIGIITREKDGYPDCVNFPSQAGYFIAENGIEEKKYELMPEDYNPIKSKYEPQPFPQGKADFKIIVTKDICRKDIVVNGSLPEIIPEGTVTWTTAEFYHTDILTQRDSVVTFENNRWHANIPTSYFKIHPDYINHFDKTQPDLLAEAKKKYPVGTKFICIHTELEYTIQSLDEFELSDDSCIRVNKGCRALHDEHRGWAKIITNPKSDKMQDIQEEAKRRFPIGCKFKNTDKQIYTLKSDNCTYRIVENNIWAHNSAGCLYKNGKWAEIIEDVKSDEPVKTEEKSMDTKFRIGDTVRIINQSHGWGSVEKGDIGTIVEIKDFERYYVSVPSKSVTRWVGYGYCFELIDHQPSSKWTPEKGDWVVVTQRNSYNDAIEGNILQIERLDLDSSIPYLVKDTHNLYNWSSSTSWCKDVRQATKEEIALATKIKQHPMTASESFESLRPQVKVKEVQEDLYEINMSNY